MAQQFGQNGYLGMVAKAASSLAEGEKRSKPKKDNDLVSRMEGEAVKAIGAKLMSGDGMGGTSNSRNVGHLLNRVSTFHQDKYGGSSMGKNGGSGYASRGMSNNGYDDYGGSRGGYGYSDTRTGGYGGGSGWNGGSSANSGYGYEGRGGYGGDAGWSPSGGSSGWDRPGGSVGLGRQGEYYGDGNYGGYGGSRGRMNDGYNGWNDNPSMSRGGYGYA